MLQKSQARTSSRAGAVPRWLAVLAAIAGAVLSGCTGSTTPSDLFSSLSSPAPAPVQPETAVGAGRVKVALILPLSGSGNAAVAAQSMKNASEMALAEFNNPDVQLLVKDDAGTAPGAQQAAQQALDEGAEIILGPLFALSVGPVAQLARARNVPVIAFSTDANVAARGVYLLSFLPETDVERIIGYAAAQGKKSFAALVPDNAYGTVVEAPSSRRSRAATVGSWRWSTIRSTRPRCRPRPAASRRPPPAPMRSSFRTGPTPSRPWSKP
jgi:branched-chain amino acid transport system substrate-binding protein